MMTPTNPYITGGLVEDPAMFFGREKELRRIRDRLRKGDSTAVVGLRRIGKSSLLYQLTHQTDRLPEGVVAVYLDLQDAAHHTPLGLLDAALRHLDGQLNGRYSFDPVQNLGEFSAAVKRIAADGYRPVLCLDEVEELVEREEFDNDFFEALRSLGSQRQLAFVTASGESLDALLQQGGRTSPFYNIFVGLTLAGLDDEAARALLTEPFRAAGLKPPPADYVNLALEMAGHHPFYLQLAAYHLFERRKKGDVVDRRAWREAFALDAERHFRGLWRSLSAEEKQGVQKLAGAPTAAVRDWERTLDDLQRCGLVEGTPDKPRLFSDLFAEMVKTREMEMERVLGVDRPKPHALRTRTHMWLYVLFVVTSLAGIALLWAVLSRNIVLYGLGAFLGLISAVLALIARTFLID